MPAPRRPPPAALRTLSVTGMPDTLATPQPPPDPQVLRYLEHVRVEKRLADRTLTLYTLDLERLAQFAAGVHLPLLQLTSAHIRRFVAQMHGAGRSGRGIALILSGWRGFYTWAGRQGLIGHNPVQDVRAPRSPKPLPRLVIRDRGQDLFGYEAEDFSFEGYEPDPHIAAPVAV